MEVRLSSEQEARVQQLASRTGRNVSDVLEEAIERFLDYDDWFAGEVRRGFESAENNKLLTHDEVGARLEKKLAEKLPRS